MISYLFYIVLYLIFKSLYFPFSSLDNLFLFVNAIYGFYFYPFIKGSNRSSTVVFSSVKRLLKNDSFYIPPLKIEQRFSCSIFLILLLSTYFFLFILTIFINSINSSAVSFILLDNCINCFISFLTN